MLSESVAEPNAVEKRRVVVLGMHRSGTSATTALINSLGAFVGPDEELTGRSAQNPRGFFERRDLRNVCDALLHSVDADWWKIADLDIGRIPQDVAAQTHEEIATIFARLDGHGTWVIKEPRLCLLLPHFRPFLQGAVIVLVARNPLEVASSLRRRNGFPRQVGLALWEAYCVAALRHSADFPLIVVRYGDLVEDPAAAAAKVYGKLTALGVAGLELPAASPIEASLHRERHSEADFLALASKDQRLLWSQISRDDPGTRFPRSLSPLASAVLKDFQSDQAARARQLDAMTGRTRELESSLRSMQLRANADQAKIAALESELADMADRLKRAQAERGRQETAVDLPESEGT